MSLSVINKFNACLLACAMSAGIATAESCDCTSAVLFECAVATDEVQFEVPPTEEGEQFATVYRMLYVEKQEFAVVAAKLHISFRSLLTMVRQIRLVMGGRLLDREFTIDSDVLHTIQHIQLAEEFNCLLIPTQILKSA